MEGWIGQYRIIRKLGEGGTGEVFLCQQSGLDRKVAIKRLLRIYKYDREVRERFSREARNMARVTHPNVVQIFDVGDDEGLPYIVMEYMERGDLHSIMDSGEQFSTVQLVEIFRDVARGLEAASSRGILHRDVKPDNIFLATDGSGKIGDFGMAKHELDPDITADGVIMGTPDYIAPELIKDVRFTQKSDVYSLGATMFHVFTGRPPFRDKDEEPSLGLLLARRLDGDGPDPCDLDASLPAFLCELIYRMMALDPEERPSYGEIVRELDSLVRTSELFDGVGEEEKWPEAWPIILWGVTLSAAIIGALYFVLSM